MLVSSIGLISENDNSTVLAEYTGLNRVATSFQSEDALEKELIKTLVDATILEVIQTFLSAIVGMFGVSAGLQGYNFKKMNVVFRVISVAGGLLLIYPGLITDLIGLVLVGATTALQFVKIKQNAQQQ